MKKQLICALLMAALSAGLYFGTEYINDYYIGLPVDAQFYDEYVLVPRPDAAEDGTPELFALLGTASEGDSSYPVYGFVGKSGKIELYTDLRKDSYAYSPRRDLVFPQGSETGYASLGEVSSLEDLPGLDALKQAACAEKYLPLDFEKVPGTPEPKDIYASDADVNYEVLPNAAALQAPQDGSEQAQAAAELLESGAVRLTEGEKVSYWRYAFINGATRGAFFPADEDGNIVPGALPSDKLYIRCTLTGTDTELEVEPQTEEAKAEKDALIAKHKEEREEAERKAREEEERRAREEAERLAAQREAAAAAAAAAHAAEQKSDEEIAQLIAENRDAWTAELQAQRFYLDKNLERYLAYNATHRQLSWYAIVQAVNSNIDRPFYTGVQSTDMSKGHLILVNKYYALSSGYTPALETLGGPYGSGQLEPTAAWAFRAMVDAAYQDGISLYSVSPFRSYATQNALYNGYVARNGFSAAERFSARPGHSEHQTGLAVDINVAASSAHFENTAEYAWLIANCHRFGFILRYPAGKEYITGYLYEPWHYRYVGESVATAVMSSGLTYEEYYAYYIDR